jgi:tetratricopeptide (TPR) repeat protein
MTNQSLGRNKRGRESSFNALLDKANVARNTKNYMAAQQYYEEALKQRPADSRPLYGLGNLYFDQTKWEQAEEAYRRALQVDSPEPETYTALGLVLLQPREGVVTVDRLREAEASLWEAYELTPRDEKAYELLTSVLDMRRSSLEEAERVHRKAVLLNPLSAKAHLRLSEVLRKIGRTSEANKYLERSDELASNVTELFAVAETWETQGRYGKAEGALRRATKLSPLDPQLMSSLGRLLLLQKHPGEAAQLLKRSVATSPEGFAPYYLLGLALLQTQNWSEAELAFDKAAMKASRGSDEWLAVAYGIAAVGDAHAKFDRLSEAIRLYEKALQYDPEDQETKDKLSEARGVLKP